MPVKSNSYPTQKTKGKEIKFTHMKYIPQVNPSSDSLTDFALAASGILNSPPMSSKRRACLEKSMRFWRESFRNKDID